MSRIASFVHCSVNEAVAESRRVLIHQRDQLTLWLRRYASDKQCDEMDLEAIANARERLKRFDTALDSL